MIKMINWGNTLRLGNWLFLYAGLNYLSKKSENPVCFPDFYLWDYLENKPIIDNNKIFDREHSWRNFEYTKEEKEYQIEILSSLSTNTTNIIMFPYFQTEKWWKDEEEYVINIMKLKKEKIEEVKLKYQHFFKERRNVALSIRRGDFVGHGSFYQIPLEWYDKALEKFKDYDVIVFSDDIKWCKNYFKNRDFKFAEPNGTNALKTYDNNPMEQFILGSLCDAAIISNSTFSWWMGWYINKYRNGEVIHSGKNLTEATDKIYKANKNYYPENWTLLNI